MVCAIPGCRDVTTLRNSMKHRLSSLLCIAKKCGTPCSQFQYILICCIIILSVGRPLCFDRISPTLTLDGLPYQIKKGTKESECFSRGTKTACNTVYKELQITWLPVCPACYRRLLMKGLVYQRGVHQTIHNSFVLIVPPSSGEGGTCSHGVKCLLADAGFCDMGHGSFSNGSIIKHSWKGGL